MKKNRLRTTSLCLSDLIPFKSFFKLKFHLIVKIWGYIGCNLLSFLLRFGTWIGHPMRLKLTCEGLLVYLANHYTTRGTLENILDIKRNMTVQLLELPWPVGNLMQKVVLMAKWTVWKEIKVLFIAHFFFDTRGNWKVHRLTKILSQNVIK